MFHRILSRRLYIRAHVITTLQQVFFANVVRIPSPFGQAQLTQHLDRERRVEYFTARY